MRPGIPPLPEPWRTPWRPAPQAEQSELQNLFEKYVPYLIDVIVEGIMDGKQGEKLKMIVPQTDLNMVRAGPRRARGKRDARRAPSTAGRAGRHFPWSCQRQAPPSEPTRGPQVRGRS